MVSGHTSKKKTEVMIKSDRMRGVEDILLPAKVSVTANVKMSTLYEFLSMFRFLKITRHRRPLKKMASTAMAPIRYWVG